MPAADGRQCLADPSPAAVSETCLPPRAVGGKVLLMRASRIVPATAALIAIQVIHAAIPAKTDAEGYTGLVLGIIALIASIAALVGLRQDKSWARSLSGLTGVSVAIGFVLYHALPIHSYFTNPYFGTRNIGLLQWAPVIGAIAIGLWCGWEAFVVPNRDAVAPTPA